MNTTTSTQLPHGSIVVGFEDNPHGMRALVWAVDQAVLERRPLVIVHATGRAHSLLDGPRDPSASRQARRIVGRRCVDVALTAALKRAPALTVKTLVRPRTARELLIELADQAHLVVVGSRDLGAIGSVARRSVSLVVASSSDTPVVVVRPRDTAGQSGRIVVGTDATAASAASLDFAFVQASRRRVPLTVVHSAPGAVLGIEVSDLSPDGPAVHSEERLRVAEAVAGFRESYPDVHVALEVSRRPASAALVTASRDAELVVVGARGHHAVGASFLGSVSQVVMERARCPVAVVHPHADANGVASEEAVEQRSQ